jgi:hypothetical protein
MPGGGLPSASSTRFAVRRLSKTLPVAWIWAYTKSEVGTGPRGEVRDDENSARDEQDIEGAS